jgi:hypothetical protein
VSIHYNDSGSGECIMKRTVVDCYDCIILDGMGYSLPITSMLQGVTTPLELSGDVIEWGCHHKIC